MRKYVVAVLIMLSSFALAEENNKGKISLIFNGEKIELPIDIVTIRKGDNIIISTRAVSSNKKVQQMITLEWEVENLSAKDSSLSLYNNFRLNIRSNKKEELRFRMNNNGKEGELFVRKGNRTWKLTSFAMKFGIEKISFENASIIIKGSLSLKARDVKSKTPLEAVSEIEDCKFEIII